MECSVPTNWPSESARHSGVRTTSICPSPKMSPDRALGVAAGLGFGNTIGTLVQGFADIMAEVGLLIGFGVLMGTLLTAMGALQKLVELLLRILGHEDCPTRSALP